MAGYFGTSSQQALQAQAERDSAFIAATAGACQAGRTMGIDDPDRIGWDRIEVFLKRDGLCGFRLIRSEMVSGLTERLAGLGYRFDSWNVFLADRATCLAATDAILSAGLPDGLTEAPPPRDPEGPDIRAFQALMGSAGIVPFSGSLLVGAFGPATTVAVLDERQEPVAVAHAYMPHNGFSPYQHYAWGGLVAVAETQRGKGLGRYVNARMAANAFHHLGATYVYELVSSSNAPSRRMVESCGLCLDAGLVCGIAMPMDGARYTR
jgi:hypothetical protein